MALTKASSTMALPFLRPMALPRPSTIHHFLGIARVSTTTANAASPINEGVTPPSGSAQPKPYRISLTPSKQYPVYTLKKRGGNMKLTKLRRIEGDVNALRTELQEALGLEQKEVVINQLTRHIIVKVCIDPIGYDRWLLGD
jgi:large subunit ribosomal protein L49